MPYAGWLLGAQFAGYIQHLDHWLAFFLLAFIGGKMVWESLKGEAEETACAVSVTLDYKQLLLMAVATSIDALAVGVTFAFLNVDILPAVTVIGCTTFVISLAGVVIGTFFGARLQRWAEIARRCDPDPSGWKDSSGAPGDPVSAYKKQRSGKRPGPFGRGAGYLMKSQQQGLGCSRSCCCSRSRCRPSCRCRSSTK